MLREDGTATIDVLEDPGPPGETTWSVEGNTGALNPGTPEEDTFNIVGNDLIFGDPGLPNRFACTPAT